MQFKRAFTESLCDLRGFVTWGLAVAVLPLVMFVFVTVAITVIALILGGNGLLEESGLTIGMGFTNMALILGSYVISSAHYKTRFKEGNPTFAEALPFLLRLLVLNLASVGVGLLLFVVALVTAFAFDMGASSAAWWLIWPIAWAGAFAVTYVFDKWYGDEESHKERILRGRNMLRGKEHAQAQADANRWKI